MENSNETQALNLSDSIDIGLLDVGKTNFYTTKGGFTALKYEDTDYGRVTLRRALPSSNPMSYISVANKENKEIGILKSVFDLNPEQQKIIINELNKRYYCPQVYEIKSVKEKLGYVYFEFLIGHDNVRYVKNCAVKDVSRNIRMLGDKELLIFDVDGNRYAVKSLEALDKKSIKRLEPFLF